MTTPHPEAYEAAAVAHEHGEGLNGVVDALWSVAERRIRAQVAAEYAPAMQTSRHQWWIHECGHVEPVVGPVFASDGCDACETVTGGWRPLFARIAEGTEEGT